MHTSRGTTLLELLIYISVFAFVLVGMTVFLVQTVRIQGAALPASDMDAQSEHVLWRLEHEFSEAMVFERSASTLGVSPSTLVFRDAGGAIVTMDVVADATGGRLRMTRGDTSTWMTSASTDVTVWLVEFVQNSGGATTGVRVTLGMALRGEENDAYRQRTTTKTTTLWLRPHTTTL